MKEYSVTKRNQITRNFVHLGPVSRWSRKVFESRKPEQNLTHYDYRVFSFTYKQRLTSHKTFQVYTALCYSIQINWLSGPGRFPGLSKSGRLIWLFFRARPKPTESMDILNQSQSSANQNQHRHKRKAM